ncbi:histidine acid phosphatase-like protein [Ceratobasidium sp. AG-Ba]|nr:histidine acid phosphatase-like protein [Ceratobasidium sp. AG-Ba]
MSSENSTVLGVVLLTRHGDRQGFYQSPDTYSATQTAITPLGLAQEYQLGQILRSLYFSRASSSLISGISTGLFNQNQVRIRADAGGEGGVIFDSAIALAQGVWPAETGFNTTLANGTTVIAPLGGYQYVPIESVKPDTDVSLEGWTDCNTFNDATAAFYDSTEFKAVANASADFLASLRPIVGAERPLKLANMIFDFLNVQSIHDRDLSLRITPNTLAQARALANWHQYRTFSSAQLDGIGNMAARTVLPDILSSLNAFPNASQPLRFTYLSLSYKPFISLFNMTGVAQSNPELAGIVDYASAITFELRQPNPGSTPVVRMNFKNGSDSTFVTYSMFGGQGDTPLEDFTSRLSPYQIDDLSTWCSVCDNWTDRKCNLVAAASVSTSHHSAISAVGAGFIGAGVTIAVFLAALGVLTLMGLIVFGRKNKKTAVAPILPMLGREQSVSSRGLSEK